ELSVFSVATPAPATRTVPFGGTAGASVSSVSRSNPWAEAAEAATRSTAASERMGARDSPASGGASSAAAADCADAAPGACHTPRFSAPELFHPHLRLPDERVGLPADGGGPGARRLGAHRGGGAGGPRAGQHLRHPGESRGQAVFGLGALQAPQDAARHEN